METVACSKPPSPGAVTPTEATRHADQGAAYAQISGFTGGRRRGQTGVCGWSGGGSLRAASTSLTALKAALDGAAGAGADVQLIWVRDLGLPLYTAEHATPAGAHEFADAVYRCDAMIWSSPTYHGSVSGSFKKRAGLADPPSGA